MQEYLQYSDVELRNISLQMVYTFQQTETPCVSFEGSMVDNDAINFFFQIAMYQCEILLQRCFRNSEHTIHVLEETRTGQKDYRLLTTGLNQKTQRNVNCILKFPLIFCVSFRNFVIQFMIMLMQLIAPCSFYLSSMTAAMYSSRSALL